MKQNIRDALLGQQHPYPYYMLCREERNLCAILYHLLLLGDNLNALLKLAQIEWVADSKTEVYIEYSFLRDIWKIALDQEVKRRWLLDTLGYPQHCSLRTVPYNEFNKYFGASPKTSDKYIQSPSTWSMKLYNANVDNDKFSKITNLKWAFKAKPDIVITLPGKGSLCIEAKLESGEAQYPIRAAERTIFKRRELCSVGQIDVQRLIFDLLGIHAQFRYLVKRKGGKANGSVLTWQEVFHIMDKRDLPLFIQEWIARFAP